MTQIKIKNEEKTALKKHNWWLIIIIIVLIAGIIGFWCWYKWLNRGAGLQITSENEAILRVYLNGKDLGTTPYLDENLEAGTYQLKLIPELKKYAEWERTIKLEPGFLTVIKWEAGESPAESGGIVLEARAKNFNQGDKNDHTNQNGEIEEVEKSKIKVEITSAPDKILLNWNEGETMVSPVTIETEPGQHKLQFSLPSYVGREQEIELHEDYDLEVFVKLTKEEE